MRSVLYDHHPAAILAGNVADLILDLHFLQLCFCLIDRFLEIRIKILNDCLPLDLSVRDAVEKCFKIGREVYIDDLRELPAHDIIDHLAKLGDIQILLFLRDISSCQYRRNRRRICAGPSYAELFECSYQRSFRVMRCRLRKVLLRLHLTECERSFLRETSDCLVTARLFVLVRGIYIHESGFPEPG